VLGRLLRPPSQFIDELWQAIAPHSGTVQNELEIRSGSAFGRQPARYCSWGMVAMDLLLLLAA
jgi:hypothetical protein